MKIGSLIPLMLLAAALGIAQMKPEVAFRAAMETETVKGDLKSAIEQYRKIARGSDRALAAKALLRMADCHAKLGQSESETIYRQVIRDYADQTASTAEARRRLASLRGGGESQALAKRRLCADCGDSAASISRDGKLMAFSHWETGDVAIRDLSTMESKRLMAKSGSWKDSNDYVEFPVFSPDARQIAYLWWVDEKRFGQLRIVASEPGAKPRVLLDTPENTYYQPVAWSPDGKSILTLLVKRDQTWQFAWVSVVDGTIKVLKSLEWRLNQIRRRPKLSPDGRYIAYHALAVNPKSPRGVPESTEQRIYVLTADGSAEVELVKTAGVNSNPIWTPDGKRILFTSDQSGTAALWSVDVQNGRAAGSPSMVATDSGEAVRITDNGTLYYAQRSTGVEQVSIEALTVPPAPGSGAVAGSGSKFVGIRPTWSPDGRLLAFTRRRPSGGTNSWNLVIQSLETGEESVYPFEGTHPVPPRWFHDGKAVMVMVDPPGKPRSLYRADLATKKFTLIVEADPRRYGPAVSALAPDDKTLYIMTRSFDTAGAVQQGIAAINLATGEHRQIFQDSPLPTGSNFLFYFRLSPDGRKLAIRRRHPSDKKFHLGVVSVDGSDYRKLHVTDQSGTWDVLAWTRDGQSLLFEDREDQRWRIVRLPLNGDAPEPTGIQGTGQLQTLDVSPDGGRIAFSTLRSTTELWALDNLQSVLQ